MTDILIIGGGLAGLFNALILNRAGYSVTLIEKKSYPFHRVCGEYISNEVVPFLETLSINKEDLGAAEIKKLEITAVSGNLISTKLGLGGFGISRFKLDHFLFQKAQNEGVKFILNTQVEDVTYNGSFFDVYASGQTYESPIVIGTFGKRSKLDQKLNRNFFNKRSPYVGIKYHIKIDFPIHLIRLDNFKNGYCGTVKIEDDKYCLCYLAHRDDLRKYGNIPELEQQLLWRNPFLKRTFQEAEFLWDKPEVINEISFEKKDAVYQHIFMSGDTAGMITPLCGNGMSMAIHSAKILSQSIIEIYKPEAFSNTKRTLLEQTYTHNWNNQFSNRLWTGRQIQKLFGGNATSNLAIKFLKTSPSLLNFIINRTHGKPF